MNANMLENVRWQPDKQNLRFVCSGLSAKEITTVKEFAAKHNASYVNQFDHNVTHVIVKTIGEQNMANSTLKYLQGIAHRKWLVSYRWIEDCNMQQKLLDEIPYEATTQTDVVANGDGPRNSRLRNKDLFEGFTFLCIEPYDNVSLNQYEDLLSATGATVVHSFEALDKMGGLKGVVIQDNIHDDKTIEYWYRTSKAAPILVDWIVECIGHYKLLKLTPYSPCLSPQDFCAIGYPRELIEEDEEYSDNE
ncbi:BRCA1 protein, partial [Pseudoatta argentina]